LPPSANIFVNREAETQARVLTLRRLAFVLFGADRDHYLLQLPSLQELLVEILGTNSVTPVVRREAYLCLRVLICRISSRELTSLWPVLLTDLVRTKPFVSSIDSLPTFPRTLSADSSPSDTPPARTFRAAGRGSVTCRRLRHPRSDTRGLQAAGSAPHHSDRCLPNVRTTPPNHQPNYNEFSDNQFLGSTQPSMDLRLRHGGRGRPTFRLDANLPCRSFS
jgi:hypothetical protein